MQAGVAAAECYSSSPSSTCDPAATTVARLLGYPTDGSILPSGWALSMNSSTASALGVRPAGDGPDPTLTLTWTPDGDPAIDGKNAKRFVLTARPAFAGSPATNCSFPPATFETLPDGEVPGCATYGTLSGTLNRGVEMGTAMWQRDGIDYSATSLGISNKAFERILDSLD